MVRTLPSTLPITGIEEVVLCHLRATSRSPPSAPSGGLRLVDQDELRLRTVIESEQTSPEEKFQALIDLAYLTGILVREAAEAEAENSLSRSKQLSAIDLSPEVVN